MAAALSVQAAPGAEGAEYAGAVDRALQIVRAASNGDRLAARQAEAALRAGTGETQKEVLADLRADSPDIADARRRLEALRGAVRSPAFAPQPARASRTLRDILAEPRYASLRAGPSPLDRVRDFIVELVLTLLERAGGWPGAVLWFLIAGASIALATAAALLSRTLGGGLRGEARQRSALARRQAPNRFEQADQLADAGDLTAAVRALAAGVAAALGEEVDWDTTPLTVREIFARAPAPRDLRPLLLTFERAVYGGRPPASEDYAAAYAAAAPYRPVGDGLAA